MTPDLWKDNNLVQVILAVVAVRVGDVRVLTIPSDGGPVLPTAPPETTCLETAHLLLKRYCRLTPHFLRLQQLPVLDNPGRKGLTGEPAVGVAFGCIIPEAVPLSAPARWTPVLDFARDRPPHTDHLEILNAVGRGS